MIKDPHLIKKRREQMIKAAVHLFIEKGFHRTTTREIAKHAGFSIGTLYEYIGAKEDVLYLVCDNIYEEVRERLAQHLKQEGAGLERLKQAITAYFLVIDEMQDEVLVMYQETKSLPNEALKYVLEKEMDMAEMFELIIIDCLKSGELMITEDKVKLLAQNILVQGQMWTFRRWAIQRHYSLSEYTKYQISGLLQVR